MDKVKNKKILEKQGLILKMEQVRVLFQTPLNIKSLIDKRKLDLWKVSRKIILNNKIIRK